jgi:3-(3-hydroxy-phenyl)propionate hydroxylase
VPAGVIAIGDVSGRLKDWFTRVPESVVLLRPDRFVAGMCSPQQVSSGIEELAGKLGSQTLAFPDIHPAHEVAGETAIAVETGV